MTVTYNIYKMGQDFLDRQYLFWSRVATLQGLLTGKATYVGRKDQYLLFNLFTAFQ